MSKVPHINTPEEARASTAKRRQYSDQFKRETVVAYMRLGKMSHVEDEMGVSRGTVAKWMQESWWIEYEEEFRADRTTNPMAQATRERLDNVTDKMLRVLEQDGVIEQLNAREIGFNLKQIIHARAIHGKDPEAANRILANLPPSELDRMIVQLKREIDESEDGAFGDSAYKPPTEKKNGGDERESPDNPEGESPVEPESSSGATSGSEAPADPDEQVPPIPPA